MIKIKTFTSEIKIFETRNELERLDEKVNTYIADYGITRLISVGDTCTTDDNGTTIGIIRTIAYEAGK